MRLTIDIQSGPHAGERFVCSVGQTVQVGRRPPADVVLSQDALISNVHCELTCTSDACTIRDLGSRFGTALNGIPVSNVALAVSNGDKLAIGNTTALLRLRATEAAEQTMTPRELPPQLIRAMDTQVRPAAPMLLPTPPDGAEADAPEQVLALLREVPGPLFAILDAARDTQIFTLLQAGGAEYQSLYEGPPAVELAMAAPYLVRLPPDSALLATIARQGWGQSWGIFLTCALPFAEVRRHLRHFLLVRTETGQELYFRFYDPRVLPRFLPTCAPAELRAFIGPITAFYAEAAVPDMLRQFALGPGGALQVRPVPASGARQLSLR